MSKPRDKERQDTTIIHNEDCGQVYGSIQDDGSMIYWCDKCNKLWVNQLTPEAKISGERQKAARNTIEKAKKEFFLKLVKDYKTPAGQKIEFPKKK
jgi:ribosome-binding protein aMBF1 (putative translation factor)